MVQEKIRNFVFTINNYDDASLTDLQSYAQVKYLVVGKEVGENGTPHLQGYCELKNQVLFSTLKKKIPTAHIESRRGTAREASDYCKKGDDYEEKGEISAQGERSDILRATDLIQSGKKMREVALDNPAVYVKFHKGLQAFKNIIIEPRNAPPEVIVIYGKAGSGKSRLARDLTEDPYVWGPNQGNWFDGYEGQQHTIFEEYRGQMTYAQLLQITDRYSCRVQLKGSSCEFVSSKIIFTSPKHPQYWYDTYDMDSYRQLERRISRIIEM